MDKNFVDALRYLSTPVGSFWKWDDKGAVVVWTNGSTLAFREELGTVLGGLASNGLPPLDAVLLLIAATRAYWAEDSVPLQHRLRASQSQPDRERATGKFTSQLFASLDVVHDLSEYLNTSPINKTEFAMMAFELAPRIVSADVAEVVCEILAKRLNGKLPSLQSLRGGRTQTTPSLIHDLIPLRMGLAGVTKESFLLRQRTGLPSEPTAPELDDVDFVVDQTSMRSLLQKLAEDQELAGLCRLARNLAAVVQLPRSLTDSDEMPLGGISDLTNRGSLDRLLLSELAHDDLMLATRIALNEALYLRREVPPSFPPQRRHVLIDAGLRMWGVPRVFSTAVALSLAASGGKTASLVAYRASGDGVVPIDLTSREGVIEHLAALEPDAHPGKSLEEFFDRITQSEQSGDVIIITTETVLNDPQFQRDLSDAEAPPFYLATVNREGAFQLWSRGPHGRKCHATLQIDLDEVLKSASRKPAKLIDATIDPDLPAILKLKWFPFRVPYQRDLKKEAFWSFPIPWGNQRFERSRNDSDHPTEIIVSAMTSPSTKLKYGVIFLTRDRYLLLFDDSACGAIQFGEQLPFGKILTSWSSDDLTQTFAVIHRESIASLYLFTVDVVAAKVRVDLLPTEQLATKGPASQLLGATEYNGTLFVIYRELIEAFDVVMKELVGSSATLLPTGYQGRRFFLDTKFGHHAMSFDGKTIRFYTVKERAYWKDLMNVFLFDRKGRDGPFAVHSGGAIINLANDANQAFAEQARSSIRVLDIDERGERILIRRPPGAPGGGRVTCIVDSTTCLASPAADVDSLAQVDASRVNLGPQPMKHFTRVFIGDEQITLVSKGHVCWQFAKKGNRLIMVESHQRNMARLSRGFEPVKQSDLGVSLRPAKWADGSRAWIDSRGLLHLQSSDPMIPEISLLMISAGVSVWTSDGRMGGSSYNVDGSMPSISPEEVIGYILTPFVSRLR